MYVNTFFSILSKLIKGIVHRLNNEYVGDTQLLHLLRIQAQCSRTGIQDVTNKPSGNKSNLIHVSCFATFLIYWVDVSKTFTTGQTTVTIVQFIFFVR